MNKIALALVLALSLAGCATYKNPVSLTTQYDIEAAYLTAEDLAVVYLALPLCHTGQVATLQLPCARRSLVVKIQNTGAKVQAAIVALRNFTKNNPSLNNATALLAAQQALADFQFALSSTHP
jgi:hypothetical protein